MKTITLETPIKNQEQKSNMPVTARGRALYTTDWFLNGKPVLSNHDNPRMTLRNGMPGC